MNNKSFDSKRIAMGYAKRPWLHKSVMEQLKRDCNIPEDYKFKNGLDVGCGAGLSTKALRLICDKVTGTDIADSMVEVCQELYGDDRAFSFYVAKAEETRTPAQKYDIVTAAGCINWVDEKKFMANMREVLEDNGLIVIYDFGITDRMVLGDEAYTRWYNDQYLARFPKPPRKENKWTQADLPSGFIMDEQTEYDLEYSFTLEQFVDFMLIQSNVNTQIESGNITADEAKKWMMESLLPIFGSESAEKQLVFSGYSWYIRKKELHLKQLRPYLYLMDEAHEATGYIVVGDEKVCVIDTMNGFNDLKKVVREITDKPIIVVNTHGHPDHIFGNVYFDEAYMNPKDFDMARSFFEIPEFKEECIKNNLKVPPLKPIKGGDVIDLGGKTLEIYDLPGHTPGGILLLLKEDRILFTGDSINHHLWMQLKGCPKMEELVKNLDKIMFLENEADLILHGHASGFDDISLLRCMRQGAVEIANGQTEGDLPYKWFDGEALQHPFKLEEGKEYNQIDSVICYNPQ